MPTQPRLKPPPNYNSKKMQLRLFVLVVACMGVLYAVTELAKPKHWAWFGVQPAVEEVAETPPEVDTRLSLPASQDAADVVRITDPFRGTLDEAAALDALDPVSRTLANGWSAFYEQSSFDEHDLVAKALQRAGEARVLDAADSAPWHELLAKIDRYWNDYRNHALKSMETIGDDQPPPSAEQKQIWTTVLDQVVAAWQQDRALLASLAQSSELEFSTAELQRLRHWQLRWERLSLAAIKDDTVHRPAELDAWFRLLGMLQSTSQARLDRQSAAPVNFVQLFKESNDYRGKLVRIRGRIMQAKPIKASQNVYGIERQYMLWIKPEGGPDSPIMVYALDLPQGFPALDQPNLPAGYTQLREDVEVTGYFFKRWAYLGKGGTYTAPLLLAKAPRWFPSVDVSKKVDGLPSLATFLAWVIGCALLAVTLAGLAYSRSRVVSPALERFHDSPTAQRELVASLQGADAGPSTLEALQQLAARDRQPPHEGSSP